VNFVVLFILGRDSIQHEIDWDEMDKTWPAPLSEGKKKVFANPEADFPSIRAKEYIATTRSLFRTIKANEGRTFRSQLIARVPPYRPPTPRLSACAGGHNQYVVIVSKLVDWDWLVASGTNY
jgi:hypothetical protein